MVSYVVSSVDLISKNGLKNLNNFQIILTIIGILIPIALQSPISFPENNNVQANRRNDVQRSRSNNYNDNPQGGPLGFFGKGGLFDFSGGQQSQQQQPQRPQQQYNDYYNNRPTSNYNRLFINQNRLTTTQSSLTFDSVEDYDENNVSPDNLSSQDDPQKTNSKYGGYNDDDSRRKHGHRRKKPCIPYQKNLGASSKTFYEFNYQNIIVNGQNGGNGQHDPQNSNVFYDPVGGYPCVEQNYAGHRPHRPHGGGGGGGSQSDSTQNDQVSRPPGFFTGLVDAFGPGGAFGQGGYFTGVNFPNGQNGQNDGQNNIGNIVNPVLAQVSDTVNNAFTPASVQVSDTVNDAVVEDVDVDYQDEKPVVEVNVPDTLQDAVLNFI